MVPRSAGVQARVCFASKAVTVTVDCPALASCLQQMGWGAVAAHERHGDVLCSLLPGRDALEAEHTLAAQCPES